MTGFRASLSAAIFQPILPGATLRERALACLAALAAITLVGIGSAGLMGLGVERPLLIGPVGASAVLLFCVPASPLAQPWSIVGGNTLSALCGLFVAWLVPDPRLAAGLAVALAIAVMSLTRSLHPPGGATALTAVLGGPILSDWGQWFAAVPVALDSALLVLAGIAIHRLTGRRYPHRPPLAANPHGTADRPPAVRFGFQQEDVDAALASIDEPLDVSPQDVLSVLQAVERRTVMRLHGDLSCAEVMSRDLVHLPPEASRADARALLLERNLRVLPVIAQDGTFFGTIGLRDVMDMDGTIGDVAAPCPSAHPSDSVASLLPPLTDGRNHAAVILGNDGTVVGIISQTDLIAAMGRLALDKATRSTG